MDAQRGDLRGGGLPVRIRSDELARQPPDCPWAEQAKDNDLQTENDQRPRVLGGCLVDDLVDDDQQPQPGRRNPGEPGWPWGLRA